MNSTKSSLLTVLLLVIMGSSLMAQAWPVSLPMPSGPTVKMYSPQVSAFANNQLVFRSAVSVQKEGEDDLIFGMVWAKAQMYSNGNDGLLIQSLAITDIRFPASFKQESVKEIESLLEVKMPNASPELSRKSIQESLKANQDRESLDKSLSNTPPKVIYRNQPTMLVLIDGAPVWKRNENWGLDAVVNSPNTIIRLDDDEYYIFGSNRWYTARDLNGPYQEARNVPASLRNIESTLTDSDKTDNGFENEFTDENTPVKSIIISTEPAELIQTNGEANFNPIANTSLMYVENSPNDIFMDVNSQQYFILLSGRWYSSRTLQGNWKNIGADQLPEDFGNIPAGSPKDNVLASVAGTPAAKNAILDAQVPQTARVNRNSASATVNYDGDPEFENISGTRLAYARNTQSPVLRYNRQYFLVDNGIWFQSDSPAGPWVASSYRPADIDLIPPSYPVYNVKYVYIYDVTPEYIYTGYTPGYLNTYVYGPTIVFGTGYYYRPWHRHYYYPRPCTWGFNMHYTPWTGWSFGFNYYGGWFNTGFYRYNGWNSWGGGWWGPARYRPSYCGPSYRHYGYYGYRNNQFYVNERGRPSIPRNYYGNVYSQRRDVVTRDDRRYYSSRDNYGPSRPVNRPEYRPEQGQRQNSNPRPQSSYGSNPGRGRDQDRTPSREYRPQPESRPADRNYPERRSPERRSPERSGEERRQQSRIERSYQEQRREPQRMERNERPSISNRPSGPSRQGGESRRPERRGNR